MYGFGKYTAKALAALLLAASILGAAGCGTTAGIEATGKNDWDQDGARILVKNVVINNSGLAGDIQVVDLKSAMAGDIMKAQVTLRSKDRDTINIQYAFNWFDAQGMAVGSGTTVWKPFIIYGRESKTIQGVAPDPRAREFKINIREAGE
jgi:uncharacterized protein YcfL